MHEYRLSDPNSVFEVLNEVRVVTKLTFRYLNDYEVLREPPLIKPDAKELHPDVHSADVPPTMFHNYLDEFLQAIRVFGFLEKPVRLILVFSDNQMKQLITGLP
jgi:lysophospholipid hydrolase